MDGRKKGQRCGIEGCRSRLYDEGEDGFMYCENGHRSVQVIATEDDDNFLGAQRRDKTRKRREDEGEGHVGILLKGREALNLYLKSLQLVLRHQIWFLVHDQGLPAELETVVFDLWTLRIMQLEEKIGESQAHSSQSQLFTSSASEGEETESEKRTTSREKKLSHAPSLMDTLALCYLGIITLRLPLTIGDFHTWVVDGKLAYWGALKLLPEAMAQKLPASYHSLLFPNAAFKVNRFVDTITNTTINLGQEYGVTWPRLNYPLLLFRLLKELALPLELYEATIRLARLIDYNFTHPKVFEAYSGIARLPEAQLISCLVVSVKLLYPFDGIRRYPNHDSEPAATCMNWKTWHHHVSSVRTQQSGQANAYTKADLMAIQEKDIFSMSEDQLDQYFDWYQGDLLDSNHTVQNKDTNFRNALYELFPVDAAHSSQPPQSVSQTPTHQHTLEVTKFVHEDLKSRGPVDQDGAQSNVKRPGDGYVYYKDVESMPEPAKRFFEASVRITGLDMDMLIRAVLLTEKKVQRWKKSHQQHKSGAAAIGKS
ncbi:hypothetical protein BU24DRAFT_378431 [Aaosphaeria arxii CBS 175.79]|uniref:RRN7-type domain-containing protein n=1 Tax=Aaosphaeria arxii CBS 175.79 TaxID=1450172 RepID=A0A6A5XBY9_9PLEO|nr:uncharacterized protein BU24DRAFT_378431 [Aaosphaeria arxii CBS 175.79]KAF2010423.1 hypothetical protein BU24DRAFT_378431 [Aaosphaeria arxii CBS 175.79]